MTQFIGYRGPVKVNWRAVGKRWPARLGQSLLIVRRLGVFANAHAGNCRVDNAQPFIELPRQIDAPLHLPACRTPRLALAREPWRPRAPRGASRHRSKDVLCGKSQVDATVNDNVIHARCWVDKSTSLVSPNACGDDDGEFVGGHQPFIHKIANRNYLYFRANRLP